jgi:hypothetical protein
MINLNNAVFTNPDVSLNNSRICADRLDEQYFDVAFLTQYTVYPFSTTTLGVCSIVNLVKKKSIYHQQILHLISTPETQRIHLLHEAEANRNHLAQVHQPWTHQSNR